MESKYRLFVLSKAAEWRVFMKKGYSAIKRFHQIYEVEIAVLGVTAVYLSMLLAIFFWFFQFKNAAECGIGKYLYKPLFCFLL